MRNPNTQHEVHIGHTKRIPGFGVFERSRTRMERVPQARQTWIDISKDMIAVLQHAPMSTASFNKLEQIEQWPSIVLPRGYGQTGVERWFLPRARFLPWEPGGNQLVRLSGFPWASRDSM